MKYSLLLSSFLFFSTTSWAICDPNPGTGGANTATGKITFFNIGSTVQVELNNKSITVPGNFPQYAEVTDFDTFIFDHDGTDTAERVFAGLLLARGTNADVKFNLRGCHETVRANNSNINRAKIFSVIIE